MTKRFAELSKRNKIIYWVSTLWLALGMVSTGIIQIIRMEDTVEIMTNLGYPVYFLTILGIWKILVFPPHGSKDCFIVSNTIVK